MVSAICQANDPNTCRYHGAVARMNRALDPKSPDPIAYYEARKEVERLERENWSEADYTAALAGGSSDSVIPNIEGLMAGGDPTPTSNHPDVQAGKVFDEVLVVSEHGGEPTRFHRSRAGVSPNVPYEIRIQANRKLSDKDVERMASLLGYRYRQTVAGESLGWPYRDTPFSFVVSADTTKGHPERLHDLEDDFDEFLVTGTPVRTTARKGPVGSRAIDGFEEEELTVEFYYDDVYKD